MDICVTAYSLFISSQSQSGQTFWPHNNNKQIDEQIHIRWQLDSIQIRSVGNCTQFRFNFSRLHLHAVEQSRSRYFVVRPRRNLTSQPIRTCNNNHFQSGENENKNRKTNRESQREEEENSSQSIQNKQSN